MDTSLATQGMPELSLTGLATTDTVGGSSSAVSNACANLDTYATNLDTFIENLLAQEEEILRGWEGTAADMLRQQFPGLIDAFRQIPPSIRSISEWASSTMNSYVSVDDATAVKINEIMGGMN